MFATAYLLIAILAIILVICWIVLPIAIIGTKPILRERVAEMKRNNDLLDQRLPALRPRAPDSTRILDVDRQ